MHNDLITESTPKLDLHGEIASLTPNIVNVFINDNYLMKNEIVRIIHGKSTNILKNVVHDTLKTNKKIKYFYINMWNNGETIVKINIDRK